MKKCDPLGVTPIRGRGQVYGVRGLEWVVKVVGVRWVEGRHGHRSKKILAASYMKQLEDHARFCTRTI